MGRVPLGEEPERAHASQNIYREHTRNRRKVRFLAPSRRRRFGYYSVLSVDPNASSNDIERQFRKMALLLHPDKLKKATPQQKAARTKQFQALVDARDCLLDADQRQLYDQAFPTFRAPCDFESSTPRVRKHRAQLPADENRIVAAIETCRQRTRNEKARIESQPIWQRYTRKAPETPAPKRKFVRTSRANCNNQYTRHHWVVHAREPAERRKDKRLKQFVVSVVE